MTQASIMNVSPGLRFRLRQEASADRSLHPGYENSRLQAQGDMDSGPDLASGCAGYDAIPE